MADDIVTRLIAFHGLPRCIAADGCVVCEAAAEIERLGEYIEELRSDRFEWVKTAQKQEAEIERLRAAGDALLRAVEQLPINRFDQGLAVINAMHDWEEARRD